MRKRFPILIAIVIVMIIAGICLWIAHSAGPRPAYKGKPLDYWLAGYDAGNYKAAHPNGPPPPDWKETDEAIRQMGTNTIPILLRMLQAKDSKVKESVISLLGKQHIFKTPVSALNKNFKAFRGIASLGPAAAPAIPTLIKMYDQNSSAFCQQSVPVMLGHMDSAAELAIPFLLRAATHTNEIVRNNAVNALGRVHAQATVVVPVLTKCLNDPNAFVRVQAAKALGQFGKEAQSAVPALLTLWKTPGFQRGRSGGMMDTMISVHWGGFPASVGTPDVSKAAKDALYAIDPEAAAKAGIK